MAKTGSQTVREHYESTPGGLNRPATMRDIVEALEHHSGDFPNVEPAKEETAPAKKPAKKRR